MKAGRIIRVFIFLVLLVGAVSSLTLYLLSTQFPPKVPLRARQVVNWNYDAGGVQCWSLETVPDLKA